MENPLKRQSGRIFAAFLSTFIVLAGLGYVSVWFGLTAQVKSAQTELLTQEAHIYSIYLLPIFAGQRDSAVADRYREIMRLNSISGHRITLIDTSGRVLADSDVPAEQLGTLDNHLTRPEVIQALASGTGVQQRHSHTLNEEILYTAAAVRDTNGHNVGIVRVATPTQHISLVERGFLRILWLSLLGAGLLAVFLSWMVSIYLSRPLRHLAQETDRIAAGRLDEPLVGGYSGELGLLEQRMESMRASLARSVGDLTRERSQLRSLIESMHEGLIVTDDAGRILLANQAARSLASLPGVSLKDHFVSEVLRFPEIGKVMEQVTTDGGPIESEVAIAHPIERYFRLRAQRWVGAESTETGVLLVFWDITRDRQYDRLRSEFAANVSHEIRTPLATIRAIGETLQRGIITDPPARDELVGRIVTQAIRLQAIIDDVLTLSQYDSSKMVLHREALPLAEFCRQTADEMRPAAESRHIALLVDVPEDLTLTADPGLLRQALLNLLDNAIKYSDPDHSVYLTAEGAGDSIRVTVRDEGIGIPAADLPRVFERFFRVDRGRSRQHGGTGLGLAIVKHVVEAQGGKVWVESTLGEGSRFYMELPS